MNLTKSVEYRKGMGSSEGRIILNAHESIVYTVVPANIVAQNTQDATAEVDRLVLVVRMYLKG
jgi:hypothetical protein